MKLRPNAAKLVKAALEGTSLPPNPLAEVYARQRRTWSEVEEVSKVYSFLQNNDYFLFVHPDNTYSVFAVDRDNENRAMFVTYPLPVALLEKAGVITYEQVLAWRDWATCVEQNQQLKALAQRWLAIGEQLMLFSNLSLE